MGMDGDGAGMAYDAPALDRPARVRQWREDHAKGRRGGYIWQIHRRPRSPPTQSLPLGPYPRFVTQHLRRARHRPIEVYRAHGGYEALARALAQFEPDELLEEVKKSGLRGRGGAGFATGMKWSFLPPLGAKPRYLCVNADESEPGTFKDRMIMEVCPHQLVEGTIIPSYATKVHHAFIYIRGELPLADRSGGARGARGVRRGLLGKNILGSGFDLEITVHRGAGAYICGEESALLESLEGKRGYPRLKPPFPAVVGLYGGPTVINNVETIATVPAVVRQGADVYRAYGTEKSKGTRIYCLSGHVERPGNYELPLGTPLRTLIEDFGGGVRGGKKLKAIIPGGSSTPFSPPEQLDMPLDYRVGRGGRLDARLRRRHRAGRRYLHRRRGAADDGVLPRRVVRQVHAVPRGHLLAGAAAGASGRGSWQRERHCRCWQTSATTSVGKSLLPAGRCRDLVHHQQHQAVPRRIPPPRHARMAAWLGRERATRRCARHGEASMGPAYPATT